MIPETNGTMAVFAIGGASATKYREWHVPVIAWDEDGCALVADDHSGRLVRAADQDGFMDLDSGPKAVALIPGDGWSVSFAQEWEDLPVVAWELRADGRVRPLVVTDGDGAEPAEEVAPVRRVYRPDADVPALTDTEVTP